MDCNSLNPVFSQDQGDNFKDWDQVQNNQIDSLAIRRSDRLIPSYKSCPISQKLSTAEGNLWITSVYVPKTAEGKAKHVEKIRL